VIRPADATETAEAWKTALSNADGPTALALSRQKLPVLDRGEFPPADVASGGYVLWQSADGVPDVILIGTGSEVHIALEAAGALGAEGVNARVVSLPSWERFDRAPAEHRESVLPSAVRTRRTTSGWGSPRRRSRTRRERFWGGDCIRLDCTRFLRFRPAWCNPALLLASQHQ
jgi:transketolase